MAVQDERGDQGSGEKESSAKDYEETFQGEETTLYCDGDCGNVFAYNVQNSSDYTLKMAFLFYDNNTCIF